MKRPWRFGRFVLAVAVCLTASACVELPTLRTDPPRLYVLTPKSTYPEDLPKVDWQLLVDTPASPAALNTARIVLYDSPYELRYFQDASWTDLAPRMVQTLLIESFDNSRRIVSVGRQQVSLRADFILQVELREFQAEYAERISDAMITLGAEAPPPTVRVRLNVKLVRMPQRDIVATETFEGLIKAEANSMADVVAAFDEALGKALKSTVIWTLQTGEKHKPPPRGT